MLTQLNPGVSATMIHRALGSLCLLCLVACSTGRRGPASGKNYTVQICVPTSGADPEYVGGRESERTLISSLIVLRVGQSLDTSSIYQTNISELHSLRLLVVSAIWKRDVDERYYAYFASVRPDPQQLTWSKWIQPDFQVSHDPSMAYLYQAPFSQRVPDADALRIRYRATQSQDIGWIVDRRLHGEMSGMQACRRTPDDSLDQTPLRGPG